MWNKCASPTANAPYATYNPMDVREYRYYRAVTVSPEA